MPDATRREIRAPGARREATRSTYDAGARTVELIAATDAPVRMPAYEIGVYDCEHILEILDCSPGAVDFSQIDAGNAPLLDTHNRWSLASRLGVLRSGSTEGGQVVVLAEFAQSDEARAAEREFAGGTPPKTSVGYRRIAMQLERMEGDIPVYRTTKWALTELSLVPIAADPAAGVRSANDTIHPLTIMETRSMPGTNDQGDAGHTGDTNQTDAQRAAAAAAAAAGDGQRAAQPGTVQVKQFGTLETLDFMEQARSLGVEDAGRALVTDNSKGVIGVDAARAALLQRAAEKQRADTSTVPSGSAGRAADKGEATREAVVDAIVARALRSKPSDAARSWMNYSLKELAIERSGLNPREKDPYVIMRAAHTTSDFPMILEAAANKILLGRYELAQPTYRAIAKRRDLRDFKQTKLLRIGDFPTLLPYAEDGEIKAGTINEGRETVILGSYGRIVRLSRQAIVNDDLNAFDDVFASLGTMLPLFENDTFYAMKAANGGNGPKLADGVNQFHASHGNLAPAGTVIDIANLGAARAALRKQKNIDGRFLSLTGKTLLVGPDQETAADQLTASIQPVVNNQVNPFSGKLQVVTEGAIAGNAWEIYADPEIAPVYAYGYLADAPGPRVMTEEPFNVDGVAFRVTMDFYAGAIDSRGAYRNVGQ